jgi:hypothetical protein
VPAPRPLDDLDRLLGADPEGTAPGALACFEPQLPGDAAGVALDALLARYRERWSEYWGDVGDELRVLEADGRVSVDRRSGLVCDAATGAPLYELPGGER